MKSKSNILNLLLAVVFLFMILETGCSTSVKKPFLSPIEPGIGLSEISDPSQFPDFSDDYGKEILLFSINNSITYFKRIKSYPPVFNSIGFSPEKQIETLKFFREGYLRCKNSKELNEFIAKNFRIFQTIGKKYEGEVHFTGYGTPIYDGSLTQTETFRYPLYKKPADFRRPYFTRREIEERNLLKGNEIAYLKSKLDAYLIHVQGSAQLNLPSGQKLYVGYAANSGHEYTSIGRLLVMDGKIPEEDLTLSTLLSYFEQRPDELDYYLKQNARYIFFKRVIYAMPHGSIGVPVTSMRSIATDKKVLPPGGLAFAVIETKRSRIISWFQKKGQVEKSFFVLDQDTGSAIKTPARADVYFGIGDEAMHKAGSLNTYGKLYYLLKR
ncbi:MAG: MltA domain-containing protein [Candidatus Scalindua sediminis]|nr:MltA domain-containing protein [Candidatus Scalindua sediminis]